MLGASVVAHPFSMIGKAQPMSAITRRTIWLPLKIMRNVDADADIGCLAANAKRDEWLDIGVTCQAAG